MARKQTSRPPKKRLTQKLEEAAKATPTANTQPWRIRIEYQVVKAETVTELERKVNDFLGAGWDISDGFSADGGNFFQPMIHKRI